MRSLSLQAQVTIAIVVSLVVIDGVGTMMAEANFREVEAHHASEDARKSVEALKQVLDYRFGNLGQRAREAATAAAYTPPDDVLRDMARAGFTTAIVLEDDRVVAKMGEAQTNETLLAMMVARAPPRNYPAQVIRYGDGWLTVAARSTSITNTVVGAMTQSYVEDSFLADVLIDPTDGRLVVLEDGFVLAGSHSYFETTFDNATVERYDPTSGTSLASFVRALLPGATPAREPGAPLEGPYLVQSTPLVFLDADVVHLVPGSHIEARVEALTARFFLLSSATYALVGTAVILTVSVAMRPLRQITDAARRLGRGEEDLQLQLRSRDELGLLAEVLNQSAREIGEARRRQEAHAEESRLAAEAFQVAVGDLARAVGEAETHEEVGRRLADALLHATPSRAAAVLHGGRVLATAGSEDASPHAIEALLASVPDVFHHVRMGKGDDAVHVAILPREGDQLNQNDLRKVEILGAQAVFSFHRARQTGRLREAHDKLDAIVRQKQVYLDILSHDLKNPIAVARGRAEMLALKEPHLAPRVKPIEDALDRATGIIEEAVLYSKLEKDAAIERAPVDLGELCDQAADGLRPLAGQKDVEVVVVCDSPVRWPANKLLGRAVENLLSNAIKWSPRGARVEIVLDAKPDEASISIVDHGPGIPPEDRPRLFARFERADRTGVKGTGLGLAIAKRVVDMHGGSIHIGDTPGGGATFRLALPLPQNKQSDGTTCEPQAGAGGRP